MLHVPFEELPGRRAQDVLARDAGLGAIVPMLVCVAAGLSWGIGNVISRPARGANGFGIVVQVLVRDGVGAGA